jgi:hypothetical protein
MFLGKRLLSLFPKLCCPATVIRHIRHELPLALWAGNGGTFIPFRTTAYDG